MSTCLVTGGAGFLGSHLCDELLRRGHRVICVDNLETGSLANIEHIRTDQFVHLHVDIIEPYFVDEPIDFVYHLASPASPIDYLRLPLHTLKVGSYGTHHTLGLAKKHRARFLIASTSEVYGDPEVHPQPETYWGHVNPIGPRGVYDEAKRYAEALTMAYHRQQGVDTAIVRIFNTYGPRMRPHDGRAIPTFLRQALQDRPITVFGDGSQTRSFCYVEDEIRGLIALAESGYHNPVNIGNPERVHAARAGQDGDRGHRLALGDRLRGAADRRSAGPPARHLAGARDPGLGAQGEPPGRAASARSKRPESRRSSGSPAERRATPRWARSCGRGRDRCLPRNFVVKIPLHLHGTHVDRRCVVTIKQREATNSRTNGASSAPGPLGLPERDVRRKRPPVLSFLLRLETLRRVGRVVSLLMLDFIGVAAALFTALMIKLIAQGQPRRRAWPGTDTLKSIAFAYLITVLMFARVDLYAERARRPGLTRIVTALFQATVIALVFALANGEHFSSYYIFYGSLFFAAVYIGDAALAAPAGHRLAARPGRLPAPRAARRLGQAHRGRRACAGQPRPGQRRVRRLHLADAAPPERPALARRDRQAARGPGRRARSRR